MTPQAWQTRTHRIELLTHGGCNPWVRILNRTTGDVLMQRIYEYWQTSAAWNHALALVELSGAREVAFSQPLRGRKRERVA